MLKRLVTVVELASFARDASALLGSAGLTSLILFLAGDPSAGDLIPETGGFRKLRWSRPGMGKRGGTRVIYFFHDPGHPLVLAAIYGKNQKANISATEKKDLRSLAQDLKRQFRKR